MNRCVRPDRNALVATAADGAPPLCGEIGRRAALRRLWATMGAAALTASLTAWAAPARAGMRVFPMGTRRGQIAFIQSFQVKLDDKVEQLAPGTRIHDAASNRLVFASTLQGQTFTVNYVRDGAGTIREIWILTPQEMQEKLPPTQLELWRLQQSQGAAVTPQSN